MDRAATWPKGSLPASTRCTRPAHKSSLIWLSNSSTEYHKIWIEQCAATEGIRERFGLESALDYLIGEKLFSFVAASEQDPLFAQELPVFVAEIRKLFTAEEIRAYLGHVERTKLLAPPSPI